MGVFRYGGAYFVDFQRSKSLFSFGTIEADLVIELTIFFL